MATQIMKKTNCVALKYKFGVFNNKKNCPNVMTSLINWWILPFGQVAHRWVGNQQGYPIQSVSIPVSRSIPFSYQFEVKKGFQK